MLISREVDYGIRIVNLLCGTNRKMDAKEISDMTEVSIRFTLKILGKLTSSKLIKSFRGAKGGYIISKNPEEISVYDVIEVLEGGLKINGCFEDKTNCSPENMKICGFRCKLEEVNYKIVKELKNIKMSSFCMAHCNNLNNLEK